jgi:hypothetical protein
MEVAKDVIDFKKTLCVSLVMAKHRSVEDNTNVG